MKEWNFRVELSEDNLREALSPELDEVTHLALEEAENRTILPIIIIFFIVGFIVSFGIFGWGEIGILITGGWIPLLIISTTCSTVRFFRKKFYASSWLEVTSILPFIRFPLEFRFDDHGLSVESEISTQSFRWQAVISTISTKAGITFNTATCRFFLPSRVFATPDQGSKFTKFVASCLSDEAKLRSSTVFKN